MTTSADAPAVEMRGISKRFGPVVALDDVAFTVHRGEVHGLLGENGAGKTTLMNILTGLYRADAGQVLLSGHAVALGSPRDALAHRVGMVHQHFELVQAFTAFENILLGAETGTWSSDNARHRGAITELASTYGFEIDLDRRVADMEIGDQQKIEILRILYAGVDILVLDEPTTHLTPDEVERLFGSIRELAADGLTVILIAHKLHEVLAVVDRVTVLRRGVNVGTIDAEGAEPSSIVSLIMGGDAEVAAPTAKGSTIGGDVALALTDLSTAPDGVGVPLVSLDLQVHSGELVGVAGVAGNGQRELLETIAGLRAQTSGSILLRDHEVSSASAANRIRMGLAALPGDRMREGVLPAHPLYETFALGLHLWERRRWDTGTWRARARQAIGRFDIRCSGEDAPTAGLSGGNIQKVLVARAMAIVDHADGGVVVAVNPTSGLDVGASAFVQQQLVETCRRGGAVLLVSEDLDELMALCDRIVVMSQGRFVTTQRRGGYDRFELGRHMVAAA